MRIYNKYIISLALASSLINISLAFSGQEDLGIYFIINIIAYLIITLLYIYLNPRARKALNTIGSVLFASFMVVVILEVMKIIR